MMKKAMIFVILAGVIGQACGMKKRVTRDNEVVLKLPSIVDRKKELYQRGTGGVTRVRSLDLTELGLSCFREKKRKSKKSRWLDTRTSALRRVKSREDLGKIEKQERKIHDVDEKLCKMITWRAFALSLLKFEKDTGYETSKQTYCRQLLEEFNEFCGQQSSFYKAKYLRTRLRKAVRACGLDIILVQDLEKLGFEKSSGKKKRKKKRTRS